jgi:hypothetical protein
MPTAAICLTKASIAAVELYCVLGPRADGDDQCSMYDQRRFAIARVYFIPYDETT